MTDTMPAPAAATLARLSALGHDDFTDVVRGLLSPEPDHAAWAALTDALVIDRTQAALSAMHRDLQDQLAQRKAAMDELQGECFERGEPGRVDWFAAKREHDAWRRRALGYARLVNGRIQYAKQRRQEFAPPPARQAPPGSTRRRYHDCLYALAAGVAGHRDRVLNDDGGPEDDEHLWGLLSSLSVDTREGEMSLGRWLAFVDATIGDDFR